MAAKGRLTTVDILEDIGCLKKTKSYHGYIMCLCPFHEDTDPSLQVNTEERRGRPEGYGYCYACGQVIRNPSDLVAKLLERSENLPSYVNGEEIQKYRFLLKPIVEKTFEFKDFSGQTQYYCDIIYNPNKGKKEARYYRLEGEERVYGLEGVDPLPWGLHTIKNQSELFVFESPQDAESWLSVFQDDAVFATCGATNWHRNWHERIFPELKRRGIKYVVLVPQNDPAAQRWTSSVYKRFSEQFKTYICWICKNRQVKDFADLVYQLPDDFDRFELIDDLEKSLSSDIPLLWKLDLKDRYAIDLESNEILKLTRKEPQILFPFIIYPSKIFNDVISGEIAALEITFIDKSGKQKSRIIKSMTSKELTKISMFSDDTIKQISKFIDFVVHNNINIIPSEDVIAKTGWKGNQYISPMTINLPLIETLKLKRNTEGESSEEKTIDFDITGIRLSLSNISEEEAEKHIKSIISSLSKSPVINALLFALTVPYMERGAILELIGPTVTGKTLSLEIIANLFGYEEVDKWWGTANALIEKLSVLDHFPMFVDEIHLIAKDDLMYVIYSLTSGQTKARLNPEAKMREIKRFTTGILSTGEKSIVDICESVNDYYPGGLITRTITIRLNSQYDTFGVEDDEVLEELKDELRYRSEAARGWLQKLWFARVKDPIRVRRIGDSHIKGIIAAMYDVAQKLKDIGLASEQDVYSMYDQIGAIQTESMKQKDELYRRISGKSELRDIIVENLNKFIPRKYDAIPDKKEVWGWMDEEEQVVYIMPRKLKEICISKLKLSYQSVVKSGTDEGWLEYKDVWITYLKSARKVYQIDIKED